jgi:hypothetical protein
MNLADRSLSYILMPFIFSVMFRFFPSAKIHWSDVWPAGILTALLIVASRKLIGVYLEFSTASEVYGAAGSLVVLLIWVYMTGLVIFFGAAFSHAWADTFGSRSDFEKTDQPTDKSDSVSVEDPEAKSNSAGSVQSSCGGKVVSVDSGEAAGDSAGSVSQKTADQKTGGIAKPIVPKRRPAHTAESNKIT